MSSGQGPVFSELLIKDKCYHSWSLKNTDISEKNDLKQTEFEPLQFELSWLFLSSSFFFSFCPVIINIKRWR